ncbi:Serine/arginine-rich splicing factor 3 [Platysternon megacephalum]|uniref:Serine/arginine-rich splicing factor 3 n=1 Tax=Platysternon megacephalum TaxID=55544 RepID=A0A4D9DYG4_9SAUR|nr:Serine/arginine-rich splicing factor 3 [Platysternon megacephalum]
MIFCQPQKPRYNLLATDTTEHPIISSFQQVLIVLGVPSMNKENISIETHPQEHLDFI